MIEVMDSAPQGLNASLWRTLMAVARLADDDTRLATFDHLIAGGLQQYVSAESIGGVAKRVNTLADRGLLRRAVPPIRTDGSPAFQIPRYGDGEHWARRDAMSEPTVLYHLYGGTGVLLYIGVTGDPRLRFEQHGGKPWWPEVDGSRTEFLWHTTRTEAEAVETGLIQRKRPPYNRSDVPTPRRIARR